MNAMYLEQRTQLFTAHIILSLVIPKNLNVDLSSLVMLTVALEFLFNISVNLNHVELSKKNHTQCGMVCNPSGLFAICFYSLQ